MSGEYVTDWPPMRAAMDRATAREEAVANSAEVTHFNTPAAADAAMRATLSGTDLDVVAVRSLINAVSLGVVRWLHAGYPLEHALNGAALDAFLVGFWTREEMEAGG